MTPETEKSALASTDNTDGVTQEDRNAAIRILEAGGQDWQAKEIRAGDADHFPIVQAFARHRLTSVAAMEDENKRLREELRRAKSLADDHFRNARRLSKMVARAFLSREGDKS